MLRLIAFSFALVCGGVQGSASAQGAVPDVSEGTQETVVSESARLPTETASEIPVNGARRHRFENVRRRGRRLGYAAIGFLGTGALVVGVSFAASRNESEHAFPFGVLMLAVAGTPLIGTSILLGIASGGLLGRSRRQLRLLSDVVPIATAQPDGGFVIGAAGRF